MRILKMLLVLFACFAGGQTLAQEPWTSSKGGSESMLAWNGGGHGARFHRPYYGHRHYAPRHRGFKHHHHPHAIAPHVGYIIGPPPYYYDRYYYPHRPRVMIQYYDPRFGVFFGTEFRDY